MLERIITDKALYYQDEDGKKQGLHKAECACCGIKTHCHYVDDVKNGEYRKWKQGNLYRHGFYNRGVWHSEYKQWDDKSNLIIHKFYDNHIDITDVIKSLVIDMSDITDEERTLIKLKLGIEFLPCMGHDEW